MFYHQKIADIYFICSGTSVGETELTSFDGALLNAGVANTNLMKMSSIVPPACKAVEPFPIPQGALLPIAYVTLTSNKKGDTISSAVAIAIPEDSSKAGVIMELSDHAKLEVVESKVREMVEEGMKIRGITKYSVKSKGVEATVDEQFTTTFAGVVLWWQDDKQEK